MRWSTTRTNRDVIRRLQSVYKSALALLYPHRCAVCGQIVDKEGQICAECEYEVKYVLSPFCMKCGKTLEFDEQELCADCRKKQHAFDRGVAAFDYSKKMRESMYRFKYFGCREYAHFYGKSIVATKGHIIKSFKPDVLMPVPLHRKRLRSRGYNQAELVAREIGGRLGIPVDSSSLIRTGETKPQKELTDTERNLNVKHAFKVAGPLCYRSVVLVDDIYTTGSTVDACARALKRAGVGKVYFVAVCTGRGF